MLLLNLLKTFSSILGYRVYLLFIIALIVSILESLGIMMLYPLLDPDFIGKNSSNKLLGFVLNYIPLNKTNYVLILIFCIFFVKFLVHLYSLQISAKLRVKFAYDIRLKILNSQCDVSSHELDRIEPGKISNIVGEQVTRALQSFYFTTQTVASTINTFLLLSAVLLISWRYLITIILFSLIGIPLFRKINHVVRVASKKITYSMTDLSARIAETAKNLNYLIITGFTHLVEKLNEPKIASIARLQYKTWVMAGITRALQEPFAVAIIICVIYVETNWFGTDISTLLVATVLMYRGINSAVSVQSHYQRVEEQSGSFYLISNILHENTSKEILKIDKSNNSNIITIKNGKFKHKDSKTYLFSDINLVIPKFGTTVINGPSGEDKVSDCELKSVLKDVNLYNNKNFKYSLEDNIFESGNNISGGQLQRIALAREILKKPRVLFLDEPTSALDQSNKEKLFSILNNLKNSISIIIITHEIKLNHRFDHYINMDAS